MLHLGSPSLEGCQGPAIFFLPFHFITRISSLFYLLSFWSILGINEDVNCELTSYLKEEGCCNSTEGFFSQ